MSARRMVKRGADLRCFSWRVSAFVLMAAVIAANVVLILGALR